MDTCLGEGFYGSRTRDNDFTILVWQEGVHKEIYCLSSIICFRINSDDITVSFNACSLSRNLNCSFSGSCLYAVGGYV